MTTDALRTQGAPGNLPPGIGMAPQTTVNVSTIINRRPPSGINESGPTGHGIAEARSPTLRCR